MSEGRNCRRVGVVGDARFFKPHTEGTEAQRGRLTATGRAQRAPEAKGKAERSRGNIVFLRPHTEGTEAQRGRLAATRGHREKGRGHGGCA